MEILGYTVARTETIDSLKRKVQERGEKISVLQKEKYQLEVDKIRLEKKLERFEQDRNPIDSTIGDPEPSGEKDRGKRAEYVARVAAFHSDVLRAKLIALIAEVQKELSVVTNSRAYDSILKGTINAYWSIHEWGESMIGEYQAMRQEELERASLETEKGGSNN